MSYTITDKVMREYPWRILLDYVCDYCGDGFSSPKTDPPKYCSHACYLADNKDAFVAGVKLRWKDPNFVKKFQSARKAVGYPDKNRPEAVARRKLRALAKRTIRRCLKRTGAVKNAGSFFLLGYTPKQLQDRIEGLFQPGMSWENYGEWEVDHIRAIATFPLDTPLSVINALSNLQPLWKEDNRRKRDHGWIQV